MKSPATTEYQRSHQHRLNLLIHIVTVPLFLLSVLGAIVAPFTANWIAWWSASVTVAVYCLLMQRFGHSLETVKPGSAGGFTERFRRLMIEQFKTFPRFVLTGGWLSNWRRAPRLEFRHRQKRIRGDK